MPRYDVDVAVIGGGTGGLVSAAGCASFGLRTVLIERDRFGGDCTWTGCVPSKALLHAAKQAHTARKLTDIGIESGPINVNFPRVMERVRTVREHIYRHADAPENLAKFNVRSFKADARFVDEHTLLLHNASHEKQLTFRTAIIASGSSPNIPAIPGLADVPYLTNETIFEKTNQPKHLVILGAGPVGVELGQAFARLGSTVSMVSKSARILPRDGARCGLLLQQLLKSEGIRFYFDQTIQNIRRMGNAIQIHIGPDDGQQATLEADALLIATGRKPNIEHLGLDRAGVESTERGIPVDRACRTNVGHILAVGDVTQALRFTHMAENMGKQAALNAVLKVPAGRFERRVVPWVTFTDPEVAHVGKTYVELEDSGATFDIIEFPINKIDRATIEGHKDGVILVYARFGNILGASAIGPQAGEIINEYAVAMANGLRLHQIASTVHAYPTMLLGARRAADQFYFRLVKRWMVKTLKHLYGYRGEIPESIGSSDII